MPSDAVGGAAPKSRRLLPIILGALLLISILGNIFLGSTLGSTRHDLHQLKAAEVQRAAAEAALPDLKDLADKAFDATKVEPEGNAKSLDITLIGYDAPSHQALESFLTTLGFSDAVYTRMMETRALDGTQRAEGRNVNATWTYHPDHGLQVVFEVEANS